jgi:hypothetical protein
MDDPKIPQEDQQRIDALVSTYRHSLENMYRMAYLQGQIVSETAARDALRLKMVSA